MRRTRVKEGLALAAAVVIAHALGGCGTRAPEPVPAPSPPALQGMKPSQKRSLIATGFPVQVPVLDAAVVGAAETAPGAAWIYEMETTATVDGTALWYVGMYQAANWALTEGGEGIGTGARVLELGFAKGSARSTVRVSPVDGRTSVSVSVGVGAAAPTVY